MARTPVFAALLGILFGGLASPASAVVGRSTEGSSIADSIVMVLARSNGAAGFCTGIVVSPTVVMTAAHCVTAPQNLRVHYPEPDRSPVLLGVTSIARHPGYRPDAVRRRERSVDLALLHLADPLPARFTAATFASTNSASPGNAFTLSGYGLAREGDGASSGRLRSAVLVARPPLSDLLLWAHDPGNAETGACTGDSGAPLTAEGSTAVIAMTVWSAGSGQRRCGDLTQALWLAPERGWIDDILRSWSNTR